MSVILQEGSWNGNGEITDLLFRVTRGNKEAEEILLPMVYAELRRIARNHLRRESANHSLQPSALVNEAYLRFARMHNMAWENRRHFFAVAATLMRRVLVDHARAGRANKRGACCDVVSLEDTVVAAKSQPLDTLDLMALDDALNRLAALDERQAKVVELRYFGGLNDTEIAEFLNMSTRTVKRDWRVAKAFLYKELRDSVQYAD